MSPIMSLRPSDSTVPAIASVSAASTMPATRSAAAGDATAGPGAGFGRGHPVASRALTGAPVALHEAGKTVELDQLRRIPASRQRPMVCVRRWRNQPCEAAPDISSGTPVALQTPWIRLTRLTSAADDREVEARAGADIAVSDLPVVQRDAGVAVPPSGPVKSTDALQRLASAPLRAAVAGRWPDRPRGRRRGRRRP